MKVGGKQICSDVMGKRGLDDSNDAGQRFLDFRAVRGVILTNAMYVSAA